MRAHCVSDAVVTMASTVGIIAVSMSVATSTGLAQGKPPVATSRQHAPIAKGSGASMCGALTQADFVSVGLHVNVTPSANVDDDGQSAYCVFQGESGAKGGVEFDVFWPAAGGDTAAAKQVERTVMANDVAKYLPADVPGAEDARLATSIVEGGPAFAAIVVRRADLVFGISLPPGPRAREQLMRLSAIVLGRLR